MNPEHPPLIKFLSGVSSDIFAKPTINTNSAAWQQNDQWQFGYRTLYKTPGNNPDKIVFWARLPVLLLAIVLGLIIFLWSRALAGAIAAFVALALYCLEPSMIAYSHFVTFDLPMAAFIAGSAYTLWLAQGKHHEYRWIWFGVSGCLLGLALASKATAIAYLALVPLLLLPALFIQNSNPAKRFKEYVLKLVIIYFSTLVTIWLVYL